MMTHVERITNSQINFKSSMQKSSLCGCSDVYILVSGTITVPNTGTAANPNNRKKKELKNCVPFTGCISKFNNKQIDNTKDTDAAMQTFNLIDNSDNYSKISGSL